METQKFGAELNGQIGGHIIIDDNMFTWKATKLLFWKPANDIIIPLNQLKGYIKNGLSITIFIKGQINGIGFFTYKGNKIADAIKLRNPEFHLLDSNGQ